MERRLAAIFAADVAGYSRLIGLDEEGTIERFRAYWRELIEPKITEHQGRIVKAPAAAAASGSCSFPVSSAPFVNSAAS